MSGPSPKRGFRIEQGTVEDVQEMIDRGNRENWDQGVYDAPVFFSVDPKGFWKCISIDDGSMLSSVSGVAYSREQDARPSYGFIGYYMSRPDVRGHGFGLPIFQHAMLDLTRRGCTTIGLDAVMEQVGKYEKSGFVKRYENVRYSLLPGSTGRSTCASGAVAGPSTGIRIVPWSALPIDDLLALDARLSGVSRSIILKALMVYPGASCYAAVDGDSGSILAYGAIRESAMDWRIGPLFAPVTADGKSEAAALSVLYALVAAAPADRAVVIDVPDINVVAVAVLRDSLEAIVDARLLRMYTAGPPPGMDESAVWGTTFLEIG
jgi:hypothetical protein